MRLLETAGTMLDVSIKFDRSFFIHTLIDDCSSMNGIYVL